MTEVSNEEAGELADQILLRNEFLGAREPGFFSRSLSSVFEWIGDLLSRIFGSFFGGAGAGAGSVFAYVLLAAALVLLGIVIYRAIVGHDFSRDDADETLGARVVFDEVVDPAQLRSDLLKHRASGDWRGAVTAGFRIAVVAMIDQRAISERPGATTGDFGRDVAATRPDLVDRYGLAAVAFERAFYSDGEIDEQDLSTVDVLLSALDRVGAQ